MAGKVRKVPNINIHPLIDVPVDTLLASETLVEVIYREVLPSIRESIRTRKKVATLFQVNSSEIYVELPKSEWLNAIERSILYYSEKEVFGICNELTMLKSKLIPSEKQLA